MGYTPADFSILLPRTIELARSNGDLKAPTRAPDIEVELPPTSSPAVQKRGPGHTSSVKRSSEAEEDTGYVKKKPKTVLNTYVVPANIVDVSDDSDDDIGKVPIYSSTDTVSFETTFVLFFFFFNCGRTSPPYPRTEVAGHSSLHIF